MRTSSPLAVSSEEKESEELAGRSSDHQGGLHIFGHYHYQPLVQWAIEWSRCHSIPYMPYCHHVSHIPIHSSHKDDPHVWPLSSRCALYQTTHALLYQLCHIIPRVPYFHNTSHDVIHIYLFIIICLLCRYHIHLSYFTLHSILYNV